MGREAKIEAALKRDAESKGIWTRKFVSPSNRSVPDRIFAWGGLVLFLEVKAPGKKPTPAQADEIAELDGRHALVTWVDNVKDGKLLLRHLYDVDESAIRMFMWERNL